MILGLALGDALGRPLEFLSLEEIRDRYGETAYEDPDAPLATTDDTSMAVAVAEALASAGDDGPEPLMEAVVEQFIRWRRSVREEDRPGDACLEATAVLEGESQCTPGMRAAMQLDNEGGAGIAHGARCRRVGLAFRVLAPARRRLIGTGVPPLLRPPLDATGRVTR